MSDYPRMLYRKGKGHKLHDVEVDYRIVADEEEYRSAKEQGWHRTPREAHDVKNGNGDNAEQLRRERDELKAEIAKFDHDGDGKPGGSKPRKTLSIKAEDKK